jgi:dTDP-glucose 4,6-dehydratase
MNKISVFGGSGFIGSKFCEMYPDEVIKIPREQREPESNVVLNLVSTNTNYNIFKDSTIDIRTNLLLLMEILESAKKKFGSDFTFIQISSWYVYGDTDSPLPFKEDAYCNPNGFYSISKRASEMCLRSFSETFHINYKIFRLGNVIGEGDSKASAQKNALQYLMKELVLNHDINLYNGGNFIRDYMDVEDVCSGIYLCMEKAKNNDIMHIASGNPYNFGDLILYCKNKLESTSKIISIQPSEFHGIVQTKNMYLNIDKLKALGFVPKYNIFDTLDRIIDYYVEQNKKGNLN